MANEMKLDRVNRWLTLGANIGVVLGLIILIIEVRQNATLTRAAMEAEKNDRLAVIELTLSSPAAAVVWTKSVRAPEELSDAEIRMVESHLVAVMLQWDNMFQMEAVGLASRSRVKQHIQNMAPYYFGSAFAKNWWTNQMDGWAGTPMMEIAAPIVAAVDENFIAKSLDNSRIASGDVAAD
ncbi:hypothetical protein [Hyphococcus sp.]|uniref:hypothetical protein n=1 Tax=Hyphococcus sp. TaxID=2038636 RepID=UPI00208685E6|nr:MAG: hypothetical protein DHS20C04_26090 [Marinicaulis sp.]